MLYAKNGGTWLDDSGEVNICKEIMNTWTDRQIDK